MDPQPLANGKASIPGPVVAGQPTIARFFTTVQLRDSQFLPSLFKVINAAYRASEGSMPELGLSKNDRLATMDDFWSNLRDDPQSFTIIISYPGSKDVIGTASVRRYHGPAHDGISPWLRNLAVEEGCEEWELKMMATDPVAQGCGVASFMMRLVEEEIVRRFRQRSTNCGEGSEEKRVRMVLSTIRELLAPFYKRRGYKKDYENARGEGYKFHIMFLSKTLFEEPSLSNGV